MIYLKRTNSEDTHFQELVRKLDLELSVRDKEDHSFYDQFNKVSGIRYAIVAYEQNTPVGCGAIKEYSADTFEIKRMFVPLYKRGQGIASIVLRELENWSRELNYKRLVLETGKRQPEAIALYKKHHFKIIPNYGQYENIENSVCFEKLLI